MLYVRGDDADALIDQVSEEYAAILEKRASRQSAMRVCRALVGSTTRDEQPYHFHLGASSVWPSYGDSPDPARLRYSRMITLDGYSRQLRLSPDFLKLDVQGYELEVLKGAESILASVEVVFTEVNHIEIYRGAPLAAELIAWLAARGFALHDICNFMPRPSDGALWQTDMIFLRHDSPLRASKEW